MNSKKQPGQLTVFDDRDEKEQTPEPLETLNDLEEIGEREMDQIIQDEEVKDEQRRDAGE